MVFDPLLLSQATGIALLGVLAVWLVSDTLVRKIKGLPLTEEQKSILLSLKGIVEVVLYIIVLLTALSAAGLDIAPLLLSLGIAGVAVSLAIKDFLLDYAAGLVFILGRTIRHGQRIKILDKNIEGVVEEIGWRHIVLTSGNEIITVPNRVVAASVIVHKKE